jgi:hypothetical protein
VTAPNSRPILADALAFGAGDFGRERAAADSGDIGFRDADDAVDLVGRDADASAEAAGAALER